MLYFMSVTKVLKISLHKLLVWYLKFTIVIPKKPNNFSVLVQSVRALPCHGRSHGFESLFQLLFVNKYQNGETVDAKDLKSFGQKCPCGFDSHFWYWFVKIKSPRFIKLCISYIVSFIFLVT